MAGKWIGIAAPLACVLAACGASDDPATAGGPAVVVTAAPDTPDVKTAPLPGLWLAALPVGSAPEGTPTLAALRAAGAVEAQTDADGRASFGGLAGPVRLCEFGTGDVPTPRAGSCIDTTVDAGAATPLTVGDAGLSP